MSEKSKIKKTVNNVAIYECPNSSILEIPKGIEKYMFPMEAQSIIITKKHEGKDYVAQKGINLLDRHGNVILSCFTVYDNRQKLSEANKLTPENISELYKHVPTDMGRINVLVKNESKKADLCERILTDKRDDTQRILNNLREDLSHMKNEESEEFLQTEAQLEEMVAVREELRMEYKECENLKESLSVLYDDLVYIFSLKEEQDRINDLIRERKQEDWIKKLAKVMDTDDFISSLKSTVSQEQYDAQSKIFIEEKERLSEKEKNRKKILNKQ